MGFKGPRVGKARGVVLIVTQAIAVDWKGQSCRPAGRGDGYSLDLQVLLSQYYEAV